MMRRLALQEPAIPFNEAAVTRAWEKFFSEAEFGRAWLMVMGGEVAGYVILTLGYSFEYRGRRACSRAGRQCDPPGSGSRE